MLVNNRGRKDCRTMKAKKIFAAVLAGALALSVTACGGGETK